ncbi:MAG: amidohydrolase, partial [Planctomycetota bacterium]
MPLRRSLLLLSLFQFAAVAVSAPARGEDADAIYSGGQILTMRGQSPEYVEALTVRDGKILAAGRKADVLQSVGPATKQVDLAGHTLLPGFIDTHGHMVYF